MMSIKLIKLIWKITILTFFDFYFYKDSNSAFKNRPSNFGNSSFNKVVPKFWMPNGV